MKNLFNVMYQASDLYAPFAGTSIVSLFENISHNLQVNVYFLDNEISETNKSKLLDIAKSYNQTLKFLDARSIDSRLEKSGVSKFKNSYATYYKLFALSMIPESVDRILYIDADTIINDSPESILQVEMSDFACAMAYDISTQSKLNLGFQAKDLYFNAGIILFNLDFWRMQKCEERLIRHVEQNESKYSVADQDLINVVFKDEITVLDPRYNYYQSFSIFSTQQCYELYELNDKCFYTFSEIQTAAKHIVIYHYMGGMIGAPWEKGNINPMSSLFNHYFQMTPWRELKPLKTKRSLLLNLQRLCYRIFPQSIYIKLYKCIMRFILAYQRKIRRKHWRKMDEYIS